MSRPYAIPDVAIGIITPSANVVVERVAIGVLREFPRLGLNIARTPVTGSIDPFPDGYDDTTMIEAARLLADARPNVILWAGSKGVLVGLERDLALCASIEAATGIPATTPSLALWDRVRSGSLRHAVLVTPYTDVYQQRLIDGFATIGVTCLAEAHAGVADNLTYATIGSDRIRTMTRQALKDAPRRPDAVLAWCTNFSMAPLAADLEEEFGVPILDATLLGLRAALTRLKADLSLARGWGSVFHP